MIWVAIALLGMVTVSLGLFQADEHDLIIEAGHMTGKVKMLWGWLRVIVLFTCVLLLVRIRIVSWPSGGLLLLACLCLFSYVFRTQLNRLRKWDPDYIGVTAIYDRMLLRLVVFMTRGRWETDAQLVKSHNAGYPMDPKYVTTDHYAGKLASLIELGGAFLLGLTAHCVSPV